MKLSVRLLGIGILLGSLTVAMACKDKTSPAAPTPTTTTTPPPVVQPALAAPAPSTPTGGVRLSDTSVTLRVTNAQATGAIEGVKYRFEWSELDSFPENSRTGFKEDIAQGNDTTSHTITDTLTPGFKYYWRARAYGTVTGEWSATESFETVNKGFIRGQEIYDPLTAGQTVGARVGGSFIDGQGWRANTVNDGIDYNIPTCSACTVEFDVTGFGKAEGKNLKKDLKWLSMGDGNTFNDFGLFRNSIWKMHLEQRSDGDGTGMKLIWRNGRSGDGDPGDHSQKIMQAVNWRSSAVFHFTLTWTAGGYEVWVGEIHADGSVTGNRLWFQGSFARAYAPPNHRISLGTRTRGETIGGIWRNVRVYPGRPRSLDGQ